jgi:proline dehydrogenase
MLRGTLLYMAENGRLREFVTTNPMTRSASRRFVAGETLEEAIAATQELNTRHIPVALDLLGENVADAHEARLAADSYIDALDAIARTGADANISIKLTALGLDIGHALCEEQVRRVLTRARELGIFVCIDMEGSAYTETTIAMTLAMKREFSGVGTVIQSYLYRSTVDVEQLIAHKVRLPTRSQKASPTPTRAMSIKAM